ncbi:MAG: Hsp20/alpha crystallin family protein [Planctomycetia bacterium]|jgi:HSP20 family protein|nr:Hsp20/alpha crystallin family protein [Planctomycetia bacterium]
MFATRWQPFNDVWSEMGRFYDEMNRAFDRMGYRDRLGRFAPTFPAVDLWQDDDNFHVEAELPGVALEDLEIHVSGENQLSLKGTRKVPEIEEGTWHRRERSYGEFARILSLPQPVDADKVQATIRHGVLTITLPKAAAAKPRRIEVKID